MRLPTAAVVTLASSVVQRCVFLGIAIFTTSNLGTIEFGRFALGYAFVVNIGQVFADPLMVAAGVSRDIKQESAFLRTAVLAGLAVAFLTAVAAPILSTASGGGLAGIYLLSACLLAIQIPANVLGAILYTFDKATPVGAINIVVSLGMLVSAVAVSKAGHSELLLAILCLGATLQLVLFAFMTPRSLLTGAAATKGVGDLPWKSTILPTAGSVALVTPVHFICLAMLASSKDGLHQTALFSTLFVISSLFTFLPAGLRAMLLPGLADAATRKKSTLVLLVSTIGSALLIAGLVAVFSAQLFQGIGPDFVGQDGLLFNICIIGASLALTHAVNYLMWSKSRSKAIFLISLAYAALYLTATYYFVALRSEGAEGLSKSLAVATCFQLVASVAAQLRGRNA